MTIGLGVSLEIPHHRRARPTIGGFRPPWGSLTTRCLSFSCSLRFVSTSQLLTWWTSKRSPDRINHNRHEIGPPFPFDLALHNPLTQLFSQSEAEPFERALDLTIQSPSNRKLRKWKKTRLAQSEEGGRHRSSGVGLLLV